jgi:putative oxidoreductase
MKKMLFSSSVTSSTFTDLLIFVARATVGLMLALTHGYGKIPPAPGFIAGLGSLGFPQPTLFAWLAGLAEFLGGLFLAAGLLTRPAAFFIGFTMAVAVLGQHGEDPFGKGEMALLYLCFALTFLALGGGRFSLDRLFRKG